MRTMINFPFIIHRLREQPPFFSKNFQKSVKNHHFLKPKAFMRNKRLLVQLNYSRLCNLCPRKKIS